MNVDTFNIRLMELNDIHESAKMLSIAMLNNPRHIAVLKGNGESQRMIIENVLFYKKFEFEVISKSNIFDVEGRYMVRAAKN